MPRAKIPYRRFPGYSRLGDLNSQIKKIFYYNPKITRPELIQRLAQMPHFEWVEAFRNFNRVNDVIGRVAKQMRDEGHVILMEKKPRPPRVKTNRQFNMEKYIIDNPALTPPKLLQIMRKYARDLNPTLKDVIKFRSALVRQGKVPRGKSGRKPGSK